MAAAVRRFRPRRRAASFRLSSLFCFLRQFHLALFPRRFLGGFSRRLRLGTVTRRGEGCHGRGERLAAFLAVLILVDDRVGLFHLRRGRREERAREVSGTRFGGGGGDVEGMRGNDPPRRRVVVVSMAVVVGGARGTDGCARGRASSGGKTARAPFRDTACRTWTSCSIRADICSQPCEIYVEVVGVGRWRSGHARGMREGARRSGFVGIGMRDLASRVRSPRARRAATPGVPRTYPALWT